MTLYWNPLVIHSHSLPPHPSPPSLLRCIPPLIPSFKSSDDLSAMGSLVNWCDNGGPLPRISGQSCRQRWGRRSGTVFRRAGAGVTATSLASKIQSGRSVRLRMKCITQHVHNTYPFCLGSGEEVRWLSLLPLVTFQTVALNCTIDSAHASVSLPRLSLADISPSSVRAVTNVNLGRPPNKQFVNYNTWL